ncbi:MAG: site-2 protease family protein [Saccharofermentanales bacterium]
MPIIVPTALTLLSGGFNLQTILIVLLVMSISLSFHEYMHGYVAYRLGDDTASLAGRLTMNPLAHLDPIGTIMFFLLGIGYAKPVPINPHAFYPRQINEIWYYGDQSGGAGGESAACDYCGIFVSTALLLSRKPQHCWLTILC